MSLKRHDSFQGNTSTNIEFTVFRLKRAEDIQLGTGSLYDFMNRLLTLPDPLILTQIQFLQICTLLYFESYLIKLSFIAILPQWNQGTNNVTVRRNS